jgi:D-serine deaminase-like pyridoxal phosphate-dependent protein
MHVHRKIEVAVLEDLAIDTPNVVVDLDVAERNVQAFQAYCSSHNLRVRPHIKTHKLPCLAEYQIAQGAVGITCQKISEAEAMLAGGDMRDILLTYNILGHEKVARLRGLAGRVPVTVVADNPQVVEGLSAGFSDSEAPLSVLVECNTGADRCGVSLGREAVALAKQIMEAPGLAFQGLMTYPPAGGMRGALAWLTDAATRFQSEGIPLPTISYGGSPDMWSAHKMPLATEYRIGTYVYNDMSLVHHQACKISDCALTVVATVISVPSPNRAIIDAGSKVLTSDLMGLVGHGHVLGRPELVIDQLSEEHGRIVSDTEIDLVVGQQVRIVPNHACVVTNMVDEVVLVRGERILGPEKVAARGQVW